MKTQKHMKLLHIGMFAYDLQKIINKIPISEASTLKVSGEDRCHDDPKGPPIICVHQKKFADQTVACFPIGPRALIGSHGLCWRITLPNSTSPSLFVLQPWLQQFRGTAGTQESQKGGPSEDNINTTGRKSSP